MRRLAVRFRGILQSKDTQRLEIWLVDAQQSGIYAVQRFARTLRRDLTVVSYALTETLEQWPHQRTNQPVENRSRGMYGRASIELLRARILPLSLPIGHTV
jgi:transposase